MSSKTSFLLFLSPEGYFLAADGNNWAMYLSDNLEGIRDITADRTDADAPIYSPDGRRVMVPQKGQVYLQNGKKFIAK